MAFPGLLLELYFALVFGVSGLTKMDDYEHFINILYHQSLVPSQYVPLSGRIFPYAEIIVALFVISGIFPFSAAIVLIAVFLAFLLIKCVLLFLGRTEDCGCYGKIKPEPVNAVSIATSTLMFGLAIVNLVLVILVPPLAWQIRAGVALLFLVGESYFVLMLLRKQRKLARNEASRLKTVGSVAVGEQAPRLQARDQQGQQVTLDEFLGQQLLLLFVLPGCPACKSALTELPRVQQERPDLAFLVIGGTDHEGNLAYAREFNVQIPFLTPEQQPEEQYQISGFPTAILLDEKGIVRNKGFASNLRLLRYITSLVRPSSRKKAGSSAQVDARYA